MTPRVQEIFHQVADLSAEARAHFFAAHGVEEETRREVEALLAFDPEASASLVRDIGAAAGRALAQVEARGRRAGAYRLLEVIGRGGMGTVYLAERADGEVVQRVAVKLLPPWAGDPHRERFLQERQILASLTHPNIARLIDAGHLDHGQPFLAMEYVEGEPIDVAAARLSVRQTIALFLEVCAAVAYLHRNLVVHRDLKPGNILVTADGEPKLLDFGIAKFLDLATDSTLTSMRMLTPDYASPEQVAGGRLSTATDIYSLGAVLYRLLTGRGPHEFPERSTEAITATVTSGEVARPSRWAPELKGDLDCILLKALRKDPQDRYGSVEQLAEDLDAFLESRPVRARSGNAWYRSRKFLRRYRVPVVAAALVVASLAAGLYIANRERALAQRRFTDVRQLAHTLFDIDRQVLQLRGSAKVRQFIVDTSLEYLRRLAVDAQGDPELAVEVAGAYLSVALVEGISSGPNLGQADQAEQHLKIAADLIQSVLRSEPANRAAMLRAAEIARTQSLSAWQRNRGGDALAFAQAAAAWLERFAARPSDTPDATAILDTYLIVAQQFMRANQFDKALQLCVRGSELATAFDRPLRRGSFLDIAALVRRNQGDLDGALESAREAVRVLEPDATATGNLQQSMSYVLALVREGWILGEDRAISLGRSEEAVAVLGRAFDIADLFVHADPDDENSRIKLFLAGGPMADILRHADPTRALDIYDHTLRHMDEVRGEYLRTRSVYVLAGSSDALHRLGRPREARQRLDRAFEVLKELKIYPADTIAPSSEPVAALTALAGAEAAGGNVGRAIGVYQELVDRLLAGCASPETSLLCTLDLSNAYHSMATLQRRSGRADLASMADTRRLALWHPWQRKLPDNPFVLRQLSSAGR